MSRRKSLGRGGCVFGCSAAFDGKDIPPFTWTVPSVASCDRPGSCGTEGAFKKVSEHGRGRLVPEKREVGDKTRGRGRLRPILERALMCSRMVATEARRRILARKTLPPRYLDG